MATYLELKAQAEKLMAEAETLRQKEIEDTIADIKTKMKAYGLTARDLGIQAGTAGSGATSRRAARGSATKVVKYRSPTGETWSGGRGRKPDWVMRALKDGKNIEEFAV
jgi:DNA-binding protein H-NS